jgi:hypothetical protein
MAETESYKQINTNHCSILQYRFLASGTLKANPKDNPKPERRWERPALDRRLQGAVRRVGIIYSIRRKNPRTIHEHVIQMIVDAFACFHLCFR